METRVSLKNLLQIKSQKGLTYRAIGNLLKMSHSTVIREVNSNGGIELYDPYLANIKSTKNKSVRGRKFKITEQIKSIVEDKLKLSWSPEQLINREKLKISIKSVYNYINSGLIDSNDKKNLRFKGKRRNKNEKRGKFNGKKSISERSQEANERKEFGHYEIDTVYSSRASKTCLVTINERVSRKYWVVKIDNRQASSVKEAVNSILNTELSELVKTITADRGKEFALHNEIEDIHKFEFYFCDPYSSWQRGANEQLNGLLREFFPKKTEFHKISDKELEEAINKINNRPRKCLNYKTPNEVFEALTTVSNLVQ